MALEDWQEERPAPAAVLLSTAYRTLARTNAAIIRATSVDQLFSEVCQVLVREGGYLGAWIGVPGEDDSVHPVASEGPIQPLLAQLDLSMDPSDDRGRGPTVRALRDGQASFLRADTATPDVTRWRAEAAPWGIAAAVTMPLRGGDGPDAVLSLYAGTATAFDQQVMRDLVEQVADSVSYALATLSAGDRLAEVAAQRELLLRRLVSAQEGERTRIANDIHDESVQSLVAIDLRLGLLQKQLAAAAPDAGPLLRQIQDTLADTVAGLRDLLFDLEPGAQQQGLDAEVRSAAWHILEDSGISCTVCGDEVLDLPHVEFTQALRIIKEALANIRKHARASRVEVRFQRGPTGVETVIADDGVGFDPCAAKRPGHRGLDAMRSRAEVTGGWLRIESSELGGTAIRFWVPMPEVSGVPSGS